MCVLAYVIKEDVMSKKLDAYDTDERVYFVVEDGYCFFETNSGELFYEISLLSSVYFVIVVMKLMNRGICCQR